LQAILINRINKADPLASDKCGGRMKVVAFVGDDFGPATAA